MPTAGVPRPSVLRPGLNDSVPDIRADLVRKGTPSYTGKSVVVGIVDSGIDVFHRCFRETDGSRPTRILSIWDTTIGAAPGLGPPAGFAGGIEFPEAAINAALGKDPALFPHKDNDGHGTWVAGIAAGNGAQAGRCHFANTYIGVAPNAILVVVKVDTGGVDHSVLKTGADDTVVQAVKYIFAKAGTLPAVVNISLQMHPSLDYTDGTTKLEKELDQLLVGTTARSIVVISGNYGNSRDHFYGQLPPNGSLVRSFFLVPDVAPQGVGHLRYSSGADLEVALMSPSRPIGPLVLGPAAVTDTAPNDDTVEIAPQPGELDHHVITIRSDDPGRKIRSGGWNLIVHERAGAAATVDFWSEAFSMKFFYGPSPSNVEPQDAVSRQALADDHTHTMTCPGTANNVISVGAHDVANGTLCDFSGRGPTPVATRRQMPDVTAPGIGIAAPKSDAGSGFLCCDWWCDFYSVVDHGGTSFAAPHVTGVVALMLERNPTLTFDRIRQILRSSTRNPGGVALPDFGWGWGKVNAQQAVLNTPLQGGGGGGAPVGGGGDNFTDEPVVLPFAAESASYWPSPWRLREILERFGGTPTGQIVAALVSTHFDEVIRLINTNRRIATLWHRLDAPALTRALAALFADGAPPPRHDTFAGVHSDYPRRLLDRLSRHGSPGLRADIETHGAFVLALLGIAPTDLRGRAPREA